MCHRHVWFSLLTFVAACGGSDPEGPAPSADAAVDLAVTPDAPPAADASAPDLRADTRDAASEGIVGGVVGGIIRGDGGADLGNPWANPGTTTRPRWVIPGSRLRGLFAKTAAGAIERLGLWDTQLKTICGWAVAEDGKERCLPSAPPPGAMNANVHFYLDAACGEIALPEDMACAAGFGVKETPTGRVVHRLGPAAKPAMLYRVASTGACQPVPNTEARSFFTYGAKVAAATFVEHLPWRSDGPQSQRVRGILEQYADGTQYRNSNWLNDSELRVQCTVRRAADGVPRCLPGNVVNLSTVTFTDAACTRPAALSSQAQPPQFVEELEGAGCAQTSRIHRLGPAVPATELYRISNERCIKVTIAPTMPPTTYYQLGEELPASRFVPFKSAVVKNGRLEQRFWVSEEGASVTQTGGFWDTTTRARCWFGRTAMGRRCVPYDRTETFTDSACSAAMRVVSPVDTLCGEERQATPPISAIGGPWCAPVLTPASTGPALELGERPVVFRRSVDGTCGGLNATLTYHRVGQPLDVAGFEAGEEVMME